MGSICSQHDKTILSAASAAIDSPAHVVQRTQQLLDSTARQLSVSLSPISNVTELLGTPQLDAESLAKAHEILARQTGGLSMLLEDLVDASRLVGSATPSNRQRVTLDSVLRDAVSRVPGPISCTLPSEPIWLEADASSLAKAIARLLSDAAGAAGRPEAVWLIAQTCDESAVISILASAAAVSDLRVVESLGLWIARAAMEMHGGQLDFEAATNEIVITLPTVMGPSDLQPASSSARRILIVDDNRAIAEGARKLIAAIGVHEIRIAHDGTSALDVAGSFRPDMILLDIGLPELSGWEVARRLRGQEPFRDTLLVALTGLGEEDHLQTSLEAGMDEHLIKPLTLSMLRYLLAHPKLAGASVSRSVP
jgi:CheY-like chemotaxis protein